MKLNADKTQPKSNATISCENSLIELFASKNHCSASHKLPPIRRCAQSAMLANRQPYTMRMIERAISANSLSIGSVQSFHLGYVALCDSETNVLWPTQL